MSDQPVGQVPHCYRHPNREALVRCTRCDRPICPDCMREASVGFHCPDDVALARKSTRPQRTSVGAVLRQSPPYATASIIILNVVVYLITAAQSHDGINNPTAGSQTSLFYKWQLVPVFVHDQDAYWRLITSAFLHVSLLHIAANMVSLFFVGPALERLLGPGRLVAVYLLAAVGGSAAVYIFGSPYEGVVGASGAIFGLFAASLVMVRRLPFDPQWLIGIIVLNFVFTFSVADISKWGHIGGFVAGGVAAMAIAGIPRANQAVKRFSWQQQAGGLGGLAVVLVVAIAVRSATGF